MTLHHPSAPPDDRERLAALALSPVFEDLHKILLEHESVLLDILSTAHADADLLLCARRWQVFRAYRTLLRTPERIAEELREERVSFQQDINPMLDPRAPRVNHLI